MNVQDMLFYVFATVSTLYVVHFGLYLLGANFYDMWQYRRRHHATARAHRARRDDKPLHEPLVTVLIPAHNEQLVVVRCLNSVRANTYKNVEMIVVDDASKDMTFKLVKDYKLRHPGCDLRVVRRRKNVGKGAALNYALRRHAHGELVMTLDADSILEKSAIANAVSYFHDPAIVGVAANVRIMEEHTILGMLQKFEHMIGYRSKKTYSLSKSEFVVGGVASTYRREVMREVGYYDTDTLTEDIGLSIKIINHKGNRHHHIVYAADVAAQTEGVGSFRGLLKQRFRWKYGSLQNVVKYRHLMFKFDRRYTRRLTWYRLPMAIISEVVLLLTPLVWAYVLYLSLSEHSWQLVFGAYLTITIYTFINLWFDEYIVGWHRVRLSLYVPVMYMAFYIMDVIQFVAVVKCALRMRRLVRRKDAISTWISPERVGGPVITG